MMEEEKSVLRWGGLAGIAGGILLVAVFVIVGVFVGPDPAEPEGLAEGCVVLHQHDPDDPDSAHVSLQGSTGR